MIKYFEHTSPLDDSYKCVAVAPEGVIMLDTEFSLSIRKYELNHCNLEGFQPCPKEQFGRVFNHQVDRFKEIAFEKEQCVSYKIRDSDSFEESLFSFLQCITELCYKSVFDIEYVSVRALVHLNSIREKLSIDFHYTNTYLVDFGSARMGKIQQILMPLVGNMLKHLGNKNLLDDTVFTRLYVALNQLKEIGEEENKKGGKSE